MKSILNKLIKRPISKNISQIKHGVKTYKEFFYYHNTNQDTNSQLEINYLLALLKNEIDRSDLSIREFSDYNFYLPVYLNESQFSCLFNNFKQKLLNNLDNKKLYNWLSLNIQQHNDLTISLLKSHITSQFEKLLIVTNTWIKVFSEDVIFKYSIIQDSENELCPLKSAKFAYTFCNNLLRNGEFNGISFPICANQPTISYQTIFQLHPTDLSFLPYPARVRYREELEKRINIQSRLNLSSETHGTSISNLVDFYKLLINEIEKLPKPKKFKLKEENLIQKFKRISDYFIRKHKILNCSVQEFMDIIDTKSNEGLIFNVEKEKKTYFFYFIDILTQECISDKGILTVIKDRFTFDGTAFEYCNNTLSKQKNRSITVDLGTKDKETILKHLKLRSCLN